MKAIEFPGVNVRIAENQPEYETLPVHMKPGDKSTGYLHEITMCFELDEAEKKQVAETGQMWFTVLQPVQSLFHPIKMSVIQPKL